jgi:hypothetical protein
MAEANPARRGVMTGSFITFLYHRPMRAVVACRAAPGKRGVRDHRGGGPAGHMGVVAPAAAATKLAVKTTALPVATAGTSYKPWRARSATDLLPKSDTQIAQIVRAPAVVTTGAPDLHLHRGERRGSNPRPPGPQPGALPAELRPPLPPGTRG